MRLRVLRRWWDCWNVQKRNIWWFKKAKMNERIKEEKKRMKWMMDVRKRVTMVKEWEKLAAKIDNNNFLKIIDSNWENINRIPKIKIIKFDNDKNWCRWVLVLHISPWVVPRDAIHSTFLHLSIFFLFKIFYFLLRKKRNSNIFI